jgi:hypothetical protein
MALTSYLYVSGDSRGSSGTCGSTAMSAVRVRALLHARHTRRSGAILG